MLTVHLNTHVTAGFLGYALAERHLHEATERYDIPMPATKQQADRLRGLRIAAGLCCGLITMGAAVRVAWVVRHADEYATSELLLSILVLFPGILTLWISFVAALLRGALMGAWWPGPRLLLLWFRCDGVRAVPCHPWVTRRRRRRLTCGLSF
uniref:Uncharacterized protein n=1 Tax=Setaria viridis TaxID=4556 RepID=A0A4U6TC30_SETVI|nr:hypothetical protein SEVIR_8G054401v2 [Setaria viridis]